MKRSKKYGTMISYPKNPAIHKKECREVSYGGSTDEKRKECKKE
jgi:hypothetical protein